MTTTEIVPEGTSEGFPAPGHSFEARFGDLAFRLDFAADGEHLSFAAVGAEASAEPDQTVRYEAVRLREGLYLVRWQESGGTTVTHVEDFEQRLVHTSITAPGGSFFTATGSFVRID